MARGTRVESWYQVFRVGHPFPSHLLRAIGLLLINALGIFALVAPLVWLFAAWRKTWRVSEGLSAGAIALLLLMTFGLSRHGASDNAYEFIQHPFVWTYWLVGSLTAGRLFSMMAGSRPQLWTRFIVVSVIVLTLVPVCYGSGLQRGKWSGGNVHSPLRVDRGLIDCARLHQQPASDQCCGSGFAFGRIPDPWWPERTTVLCSQARRVDESKSGLSGIRLPSSSYGSCKVFSRRQTFRTCSAVCAKPAFAGI